MKEHEMKKIDKSISLDTKSAAPIKSESQLYAEQLEKALDIIQKIQDDISKKDNKKETVEDRVWESDRVHQNMGILGCRGAGKTSFLLTLIRILDPAESDDFRDNYAKKLGNLDLSKQWKELANNSLIVALIEPSMLEDEDHIVASTYARILQKAKSNITKRLPTFPKNENQLDDFWVAAEKVNKHLPVLFAHNRLSEAYKADGPEGLYDEIIQNRAVDSLEKALTEFLKVYLNIEEKPLLILAMDDVDLAYEHGFMVMESLRRYLTSYKMLVLVTGDPNQFESVIHQQYLKKRTGSEDKKKKTQLDSENENIDIEIQTRDNIEELTQHYLSKLLPFHYRINLPAISLKIMEKVEIKQPDSKKPDELETVKPEKDYSINFTNHFTVILKHCLRINDDLYQNRKTNIKHTYSFLIPENVRQIIELCHLKDDLGNKSDEKTIREQNDKSGGENDDRKNNLKKWFEWREEKRKYCENNELLLKKFAEIWHVKLKPHGLTPQLLWEWCHTHRAGLGMLNLLVSDNRLDEVALRLDPRTDNQGLNVAMAFMRFSMEAYLDRNTITGLLAIGLDFCVPAHYLNSIKSSKAREKFRRETELHLLDSPRRLFHRIVSWQTQQKKLQPGMIPLVNRPGSLATFMDLNDPSPTAAWRWILGDPKQSYLSEAQNKSVRRCRKYLKNENHRRKTNDESTTTDKIWNENSGYCWSTGYLPILLNTEDEKKLFESHSVRQKTGDYFHPLAPEYIPTPHLFQQLAGMLPKIIFRCWTLNDRHNTYLNPWQCLTLAQRIIFSIDSFIRKELKVEDFISEGNKFNNHAIKQMKNIIHDCLTVHLGLDRGGYQAQAQEQEQATQNRGFKASEEMFSLEDHPRELRDFFEELSTPKEPKDFYFSFNSQDYTFHWRVPPSAVPSNNNESDANLKENQENSVKENSNSKEPKKDIREIKNWNDLQACQLEAFDNVLERLASAITKWTINWAQLFMSDGYLDENYSRSSFEEIQNVFTAFLNNMGDDKGFSNSWSGAGDIIQRWILTFLNAVLVNTLQPPRDIKERGDKPRPQLIPTTHQTYPCRAASELDGCNHALYQNLTRLIKNSNLIDMYDAPLDSNNKTKWNDFFDSEWHWSDHFHMLASFPLFAIFLPSGGPIPKMQEPEKGEKETYINHLPKMIHELDLTSIIHFGSLMLFPIPEIPEEEKLKKTETEKQSCYLKLAGLSWCGIDLKEIPKPGKSAKYKEGQPPILTKVEDRRKGLIAMLNSMAADVEPFEDADKYLNQLTLIVKNTIKEDTVELFKSIKENSKKGSKSK